MKYDLLFETNVHYKNTPLLKNKNSENSNNISNNISLSYDWTNPLS